MDPQKEFAKKLLSWFRKHKRTFSWRARGLGPYEILIAEIMLQKTPANRVEKVFPHFVEKYPTIESLAKSSLADLEKELELLGLHRRRAKMLRDLAPTVQEKYGGVLPTLREDLLSLPGIGEYVADALLCFAFKKDVPLIDVNVSRVMSRVFSTRSSKETRKILDEMMPEGQGRDLNLALIDFASLVCKSSNPQCGKCFIRGLCQKAKKSP